MPSQDSAAIDDAAWQRVLARTPGPEGYPALYAPFLAPPTAPDGCFVLGRIAQTLDGRIATESGMSFWISGPEDILHTHRLRALCDAIVVGADTIVVLNGKVYGKPKDEADAFRMLSALQGTMHEVYSGITVFHPVESPDRSSFACDALCTQVHMRPLTPEAIEAYIATGEPMDKAGAYAIQGYGSTLIEKIDGCYFNVVGMSLYLLERLFEQLGEKLVL